MGYIIHSLFCKYNERSAHKQTKTAFSTADPRCPNAPSAHFCSLRKDFVVFFILVSRLFATFTTCWGNGLFSPPDTRDWKKKKQYIK